MVRLRVAGLWRMPGAKSAQVLTKFASQAGETYRQEIIWRYKNSRRGQVQISERPTSQPGSRRDTTPLRRSHGPPMVEAGAALGESIRPGHRWYPTPSEDAVNNAVGAARTFPFSTSEERSVLRAWLGPLRSSPVGIAFAQGIADTAADAAAAAAVPQHEII